MISMVEIHKMVYQINQKKTCNVVIPTANNLTDLYPTFNYNTDHIFKNTALSL